MEELLIRFGFKRSETIPNEFVKGKCYKAILSINGYVVVLQYTPTYQRLLDSTTYYNIKKLENELFKNHY